tara:strand:+ start:111 stop:581 length:471 start_codon:yes stop_codon:yes gene_type:complete
VRSENKIQRSNINPTRVCPVGKERELILDEVNPTIQDVSPGVDWHKFFVTSQLIILPKQKESLLSYPWWKWRETDKRKCPHFYRIFKCLIFYFDVRKIKNNIIKEKVSNMEIHRYFNLSCLPLYPKKKSNVSCCLKYWFWRKWIYKTVLLYNKTVL